MCENIVEGAQTLELRPGLVPSVIRVLIQQPKHAAPRHGDQGSPDRLDQLTRHTILSDIESEILTAPGRLLIPGKLDDIRKWCEDRGRRISTDRTFMPQPRHTHDHA